ncbi:mRNA splicing protein [Saccharomycopsis crataegensis]|uniref:Small nuclear ribonucleoprotein Sm D3 n=1 Tax=Saccharomycopsis crataegensis TaxID=43959 RepID=A0AAV5QK91_9ASCO|nr:mRNA splicing protein [Saccharomycopsis crataegensis]
MSVGIPVKLLSEAQGHVISVELNCGDIYRGKLIESEDNMNIQLKDITVTARDGKSNHLDQVFIRGSNIRLLQVPDMLRNAPMFNPNHVKPPPPGRGGRPPRR